MESESNISLPREKCMKCQEESHSLLRASTYTGFIGLLCNHTFCQSCFRMENISLASSLNHEFTCPCCHSLFYGNMQSIDEAILIGEAATIRTHIYPHLLLPRSTVISEESIIRINDLNNMIIEKLKVALELNAANFYSLYFLYSACADGHRFLITHKLKSHPAKFYRTQIFYYAYKILDNPALTEGRLIARSDCCYELASLYQLHHNYPAAFKYAKLAYEYCLRSSEYRDLSSCKTLYLDSRADFSKLPPLRFAVGDEVEFLQKLETGNEWRLGKVVELYFLERDFDITFTAPYRLQLINASDAADQPPVYGWVKADIDRYVRKVGVRSIEDTRYQARLDAKFAKFDQVYCSKEFIQDIYRTLAQDLEFVEMLQSVWQVELSEPMLGRYSVLVMQRAPLVRTDSGYMPSSEEVIAGIRAYFDSAYLSGDASTSVVGADTTTGSSGDSAEIRAVLISAIQGNPLGWTDTEGDTNVQALLLRSMRNYIELLHEPVLEQGGSYATLTERGGDFTVPVEVSDAISRVSVVEAFRFMYTEANYATELKVLLEAWIGIHICLELPNAESACECPFVYLFIKYCLEHDLGVPKLALNLYDRMNMQLSREFIRCANPTCELNRLDQSTGQVKFKNCSRCKAVIYCSRECQTAHYPEHKRLCREHAND